MSSGIPKLGHASFHVIYSRAPRSQQSSEPTGSASQDPVEPVTPSPGAAPRWVTRGRVLGLLIGLAIATAVIVVRKPALIWEGLQEVDLGLVIGALLVNIPIVLLRALRAQVLLRFLGHEISLRAMIPVQLVGQTSSTVTPAASGDYVRAYIWRRLDAVPVRDGAAVVTYERLFSLFLLVVVIVLLII